MNSINSITNTKIGFGTYKIIDENQMLTAIIAASKNKYDFIDTAVVYENEHLVGNAIEHLRKNNMFIPIIQSKLWVTQYELDIIEEVKKSIEKLKVKAIDCYLLHRPHVDMTVNVKAWKGLIKAQKMGLIKEIGVSNFDRDQIELLYNETNVYPICNQIECSVTYYRPDRMFYNKQKNISIQGWRPMGDLNQTLNSSLINKMAKKYKVTKSQLLVSFTKTSGAIPIIKSVNPDRIKENKKMIKISNSDFEILEKKLNTHTPTTTYHNDSFANLSLNNNWYKTH
ncbi:aldo/keto reductase family protein [Malacoplasma muris]|uniref:aldo/keto reductase family protein n=1 Tax=Malacoplasma muris TaxID=2119 RepID=UPI00398F6481